MPKDPRLNRRKFLQAAGGSVIAIGLPGVFIKAFASQNRAWAGQLRPDGRPRLPPGQHVVEAMPAMGGVPGTDDLAEWRLEIGGEVERPLTLTWADFMNLPQTTRICDVHCVTGWTLLDSRWNGVALTTLMELAGVKPRAGFVIFKAPHDYSSNIDIQEARKPNVMLAHTFAGQPLETAHGAPLRGLVPDRYFYKSVKWVTGITFTVRDEPGYYESAGFSNTADPWKEERYP